MKHNGPILTSLAILLLLVGSSGSNGQTVQTQPGPAETQRSALGGDPIRQLNLTPEQREQIRSIREQNRTERAALNQRVRDANLALDAGLDADNPDEAALDQQLRELAAAQAAVLRMRILTEIKIRRVLTLEQRSLLRNLQRQARELRRERIQENTDARQKRQAEQSPALRDQRNGPGTLLPRRQAPRPRF